LILVGGWRLVYWLRFLAPTMMWVPGWVACGGDGWLVGWVALVGCLVVFALRVTVGCWDGVFGANDGMGFGLASAAGFLFALGLLIGVVLG